MAKSYWDMHDEHENEISKIPYHDNILTYFYEAPSIVRALVERSVSAEKLFSEALHASGDETLASFFDLWVRNRWEMEDTIEREKLSYETDYEEMSNSLFEIAEELQALVRHIRNSKRLNREYIFNTIRRLAKQAEADSGR